MGGGEGGACMHGCGNMYMHSVTAIHGLFGTHGLFGIHMGYLVYIRTYGASYKLHANLVSDLGLQRAM